MVGSENIYNTCTHFVSIRENCNTQTGITEVGLHGNVHRTIVLSDPKIFITHGRILYRSERNVIPKQELQK